jgi:hypothetical protein
MCIPVVKLVKQGCKVEMANRCGRKSGQERAAHSLGDGIYRLKHLCAHVGGGRGRRATCISLGKVSHLGSATWRCTTVQVWLKETRHAVSGLGRGQ